MEPKKVAVWPDTNSLIEDRHFSNLGRLMRLVGDGAADLWCSPVVVAELRNRLNAEVQSCFNGTNALARRLGVEHEELGVDDRDSLHRLLGDRLSTITTAAASFEGGVSASAMDVADREIRRRRPFKKASDAPPTGHLDTLIWLGAVEALLAHPGHELFLVTADDAFLGRGGELHSHLREDLEAAGIDAGRVTPVKSLWGAVEVIEARRRSARDRERQLKVFSDLQNQLLYEAWGDAASEGWFEVGPGLPVDTDNLSLEELTLVEFTDESLDDPEPVMEDEDSYSFQAEIDLVFESSVAEVSDLGEDVELISVGDDGVYGVRFTRRVLVIGEYGIFHLSGAADVDVSEVELL